MGPWMCQLLATPCVALSLALGGSDPSSVFHLRTLSFGRPLNHPGARLGYDFHIPCYHSKHDVQGVGEVCDLSLPSPLLRLRGPNLIFLLVVTLWGY
jgi:hypothetical protein